jgi:hypothetical protein
MLSVHLADGRQCHLVMPIAVVAVGLAERHTSYAFTASVPP